MATRSEQSSDKIILDAMRAALTEEQLKDFDLISELSSSGLGCLNTWRHTFIKAIKDLTEAYGSKVIR
jgi:hypothetical protein